MFEDYYIYMILICWESVQFRFPEIWSIKDNLAHCLQPQNDTRRSKIFKINKVLPQSEAHHWSSCPYSYSDTMLLLSGQQIGQTNLWCRLLTAQHMCSALPYLLKYKDNEAWYCIEFYCIQLAFYILRFYESLRLDSLQYFSFFIWL